MNQLLLIIQISFSFVFTTVTQDSIYESRVYFNKAKQSENNCELVKALELYQKAFEYDQTYAAALEEITDILILYGKRDSLLALYEQKTKTEPGNPLYHYIYGKILPGNGAKKSEFLTCIELDSLYYRGYAGLGTYYYETGNIDSALFYYNKAIRINPAIIDGHYLLGKLYFEQENYEEAEMEFKKCNAINPRTYVDTYYKLALIYEYREQPEEALSYYNLFLRYAPNAAEVDHILNVMAYLQFRIDEKNRDDFFYRLKKRLGEIIK